MIPAEAMIGSSTSISSVLMMLDGTIVIKALIVVALITLIWMKPNLRPKI